MERKIRNTEGSLYLVVDPEPGRRILLPKIRAALEGGVDVLQLWNHWNETESRDELIHQVCDLAHLYDVPVIIHEHWRYLEKFPLDGVHFETLPENLSAIRQHVNRPFLSGVTCGNDQQRIEWAIDNKLDYLSFCSMYPSTTANSCELVSPDIVRQTCMRNAIAVYVAGGVTPDTIPDLRLLGVNGVAVVSGIMKAENPAHEAARFKQLLRMQITTSIL